MLAPAAFVLANFIVYWAGWATYSTLMVVMLIGYVLIAHLVRLHLNPNRPRIDWAAASWVFPYLIGMGVISYLGSFGARRDVSGILERRDLQARARRRQGAVRPVLWTSRCSTVFSLVIYYAAIARPAVRAPRSTTTCARCIPHRSPSRLGRMGPGSVAANGHRRGLARSPLNIPVVTRASSSE